MNFISSSTQYCRFQSRFPNNDEWEYGFESEPGSFVVHFAGLGAMKLAHMVAWLDELQRNQAQWKIR